MAKKSFVPETNIPYKNWIQAWLVTLRVKRNKVKKKSMK